MTTPIETAVTTAKTVVVLDHIKNNRIEYLVLVAIGHLIGATTFLAEKVSGVCA